MSPEVSEDEEAAEPTASSDSEDESRPAPTPRQKIVVRRLSWRSRQFNDILESLDRKTARRQTHRSMSMSKVRERSQEVIQRVTPEGIPPWMHN